jgi:hypothetical protein
MLKTLTKKMQKNRSETDKMKGLWESWIKTGKISPEKKYFGILNKNIFSGILIISLILGITANIGIWLIMSFISSF